MSDYFKGVTFAEQPVAPADDAIVRRSVLADSILSGCKLSYSGSTLTMTAGRMIACGREFRHVSVQNWPITGAASGYARLLLTIDLTRTSTEDTFDQIIDTIEYATAADGFPELQQDDINVDGNIYQVPVCVMSMGPGGITGIVSQLTFANLGKYAYPIGSIYLSVNETSPAELFGGTWERLKDRFLLAAGDTYAAGTTGGAATHKLTADEMPTLEVNIAGGTGESSSASKAFYRFGFSKQETVTLEIEGGDQAHNNMPPYLAVYMWVRTA